MELEKKKSEAPKNCCQNCIEVVQVLKTNLVVVIIIISSSSSTSSSINHLFDQEGPIEI